MKYMHVFVLLLIKLSHTHRFQWECGRGDGAATDDPWQGWCEEVGCTSFGSPRQNGVSHHQGGTRTSTAVHIYFVIIIVYRLSSWFIHIVVHVNDVVTDWSTARTRLLVSQFSHWKCFLGYTCIVFTLEMFFRNMFFRIHMYSIWVVTNYVLPLHRTLRPFMRDV